MQPLSSFSSTQRNLQLDLFLPVLSCLSMETVSLILHIVCICKDLTSYYIPAAAALGGPGPLAALALHPQHHGAPEAGAARQPPQQQPRQQGGDRAPVLCCTVVLYCTVYCRWGPPMWCTAATPPPPATSTRTPTQVTVRRTLILLFRHHCELRLKILQAFNKQFTISAVEYCD